VTQSSSAVDDRTGPTRQCSNTLAISARGALRAAQLEWKRDVLRRRAFEATGAVARPAAKFGNGAACASAPLSQVRVRPSTREARATVRQEEPFRYFGETSDVADRLARAVIQTHASFVRADGSVTGMS